MFKYTVLETTDKKYIGVSFILPFDPFSLPNKIPIEPGINFRIDKVKLLYNNVYMLSNPNYIAIARVEEV